MKTLSLELPPEMYHRLEEEAKSLGKPSQAVVQEWLVERLAPPPLGTGSDRDKARQALRVAGLLSERSPGVQARLDRTVRLKEVEAALSRAEGKPLSEIVMEQRGPKE